MRTTRVSFGGLAIVLGLAPLVMAPEASRAAQKPGVPSSISDLKPFEQDDRLLQSEPRVEVGADGTAIVTFDSMVPTPGARAFVGMPNPEAVLDTPIYRLEAREVLKEPATAHRLSFDLKRIERAVGIAQGSPAHEADVYVRLEVFDSRTVGVRYFEWRFHYAADAGRYERRPAVRLGPAVDQTTVSSVLLDWSTDLPALGVVHVFSADGGALLQSVRATAEAATDHRVAISGLRSETSYRYQVVLLAADGKTALNTGRTYAFRTAPRPGRKFAFAFMSDGRAALGGGLSNFSGVNAVVTRQLLADSYSRGVELILFGGDLASGFTSSTENFGMMLDTWRLITDPVAHMLPIYEGIGNHESLHEFYRDASGNRYERDRAGDVNSESEFARRFANPDRDYPAAEVRDGRTGPSYRGTVYSFDYGNAHFVMLNMDYWYTGGGPAGDRSLAWVLLGGNRNGYLMEHQLQWLANDLKRARARGAVHLFVCGHDPAFPTGGHAGDAMWWGGLNDPTIPSGDVTAMRSRFLKIVSDNRVTALFFGHEHAYSRLVIDQTVDPVMQVPVTQIISGGAGAPAYARDPTVPWVRAVRKFASAFHYVLIVVDGPRVSFSAIDADGNIIDSGALGPAK